MHDPGAHRHRRGAHPTDCQNKNFDPDLQLSWLDPENRTPGPNRGNVLARRAQQMFRLDLDHAIGRFRVGATGDGSLWLAAAGMPGGLASHGSHPARPPMQHVIVTGRGARQEIIDLADTVSEVKSVKHAFDHGIRAQKGIEL